MIVLITGISGYIGFHLAQRYYSEGYKIIGVYHSADKDKLEALRSIFKGIILIQSDLCDTIPVIPSNIKYIDIVIHCAALKGIVRSNENPMLFYSTNIKTMLNTFGVVDNVKIGQFVFISTGIAAIGDSPYAKSKALCESILKELSNSLNIKTTVLRYFNPIGAENYLFIDNSNILNTLYKCEINKAEFPIFGESIRDYIDIRDASNSVFNQIKDRCLENELFKILEVGTAKGKTIIEFIEEYSSCRNAEINTRELPARINDVSKSVASYGCTPMYSLSDTINSYVKLLNNR